MGEIVSASYGKGSAKLRLPEDLETLSARAPAGLGPADVRAALARAIRAAPQPAWEIQPPVAVVVPDRTRPLDHEAVFAALAPLLADAPAEVVVGAGLHPATPVPAPWPCHAHDAESRDLVEVAGGLSVHPVVARARTLIAVSALIPHYLAGFSGGPKALVPGVADARTILAVHESATGNWNGVIEGNPFQRAIRERVAGLVGAAAAAFGVNLLVGPKGPFDATAGELFAAHEEAVSRYRAACVQPKPEPADVVVADAGGHPVDATLLQSHKAYEAAAGLVKPGGLVVLVAACDEGFGHEEFRRRMLGEEAKGGSPERGDAEGIHPYARTAEAWRRKARFARTLMVTELDVSGLGVERVRPEEVGARIPGGARVLWAPAAQDLLFDP